MRRTSIVALLYLLLVTPSPGQLQSAIPSCSGRDLFADMQLSDAKSYAAIRAAADATPNARAILWRIEAEGRPTSFLFGTVHTTDERVNTLSPAVRSALESANTVALELAELASGNPGETIAKAKDIAKLIVYQGGNGLRDHLSENELNVLRTWLAMVGIPPDVAHVFRPWFAWVSLALPACEQKRASAGVLVLDQRVGQSALKRGKRVVGLETVDSQINALAGMPEATQVYLLKTTLAVIDTILDQWETVHSLYLARDLGAVWPFGVRMVERAGFDVALFDQVARDIIEKRNFTMRDAALPLLKEGNAFIAVGSLHLPGKSGLVELFREAGFTVTAVE